MKKILFSANFLTLIAFLLGVASGFLDSALLTQTAEIIADIAIRLMKLISVPLLFLSIVSSASHFKDFTQIKKIGARILKYTIFTTFIAALIAEVLYLLSSPYLLTATVTADPGVIPHEKGFFSTVLRMIPDNLFAAFYQNNVMAVVVIAIALAIALLGIRDREKEIVFGFFVGLLNAVMRIVHYGLRIIPLAVWAFVTILTRQLLTDDTESLNAIGGLTLTVISANLIQGLFILPLLLAVKRINPMRLFAQMKDGLIVAFFSRSSMAALPITLDRAIKDARINPDVARLSLPLCTTINMNGCAQFILLSVYFVCAFTGNPLTPAEHIGMIFLSVTAAIGNAGVPMGCFFLASSILASKDIPLHLMGSILPLYAFIDMVETALNVWSDVSISKIVSNELYDPAKPAAR